jgi:hypothetical protein
MTGSLSQTDIARFDRDGILFPLSVLPQAEAAACLARLEVIEAREGGRLSRATNTKPHLRRWVWPMRCCYPDSKKFFFEKKNQKTFISLSRPSPEK